MKTWFTKHKQESSLVDRIADMVAAFCGSWLFFFIHIIWFASWIVFKIEPFPYGLLTMIVSLEAILLSTVIMISQTRSGDRDRAQAQHDYKTNEDAKADIEQLQIDIARIENDHLKAIIAKLDTLAGGAKKNK